MTEDLGEKLRAANAAREKAEALMDRMAQSKDPTVVYWAGQLEQALASGGNADKPCPQCGAMNGKHNQYCPYYVP